jgi:glycosyltransferase involved in cell wall biosynthesis
MEMRPALEGFAGIPQEVRLLFRGLRTMPSNEVEGLLQTYATILASGTKGSHGPGSDPHIPGAVRFNSFSKIIISLLRPMEPLRTARDRIVDSLKKRWMEFMLTVAAMFGARTVRMSKFEPRFFEDFIWRLLFQKSLPPSDFANVTSATIRVCSTPWIIMHLVALNTLKLLSRPIYPRLDTRGVDVFIAQTPYPARVRSGTVLLIRYHDAIPLFLPHTIPDKEMHQATHFYALQDNVKSGAYFACVSEASRAALLSVFPEAEARTFTVHNLVSHNYFLEDSPRELAAKIVRSRLLGRDVEALDHELLPKFSSVREEERFYRRALDPRTFKYLMVVCSIEPRKNHARLIAAWETLMAETDPEMKLVIVGTLGWDFAHLLKSLRIWADRGRLFMLNSVPAAELRVLYRHASATVCPSLAEGFDFAGVEAMRSGGLAIASDIPSHREIYDDAAEYFDPYSTAGLVGALKRVLYDADAPAVQERLRKRGAEVSDRYTPERILPQWELLFQRVTARGKQAVVETLVPGQTQTASLPTEPAPAAGIAVVASNDGPVAVAIHADLPASGGQGVAAMAAAEDR